MTANEKLKSLYGDLERYKKAITEEMHRVAKDVADAADRQMAEIGETTLNQHQSFLFRLTLNSYSPNDYWYCQTGVWLLSNQVSTFGMETNWCSV